MLLEIRKLHVLSGDGQTADVRRVLCPARTWTVTLEQCLACQDSGGGVVRDPAARIDYASCNHAGEARPEGAGDLADRTPMSALMRTQVFAVRPEVSLEAFTELLLDRGIGGAPVVDEDGRPVGVASKTDLLDDRFARGDTGEGIARGRHVDRGHFRVELGPGVHVEPSPYESVGDAMTRAAFTLPEDAPVARAAAIMAERGVHRVLVVAEDGKLSGIVTATDLMRWIAERAGELRPEA